MVVSLCSAVCAALSRALGRVLVLILLEGDPSVTPSLEPGIAQQAAGHYNLLQMRKAIVRHAGTQQPAPGAHQLVLVGTWPIAPTTPATHGLNRLRMPLGVVLAQVAMHGFIVNNVTLMSVG